MRHADDPLAKKPLLVARNRDAVADQVIHVAGPRGPGKSEIIDLQRRRPEREDTEPPAARVSRQIDRNIDFAFAQQHRDLAIAGLAHVVEVLEGLLHPQMHRTGGGIPV